MEAHKGRMCELLLSLQQMGVSTCPTPNNVLSLKKLIMAFHLSEILEDEAYCKNREMSSSSARRGFLYLWLDFESL